MEEMLRNSRGEVLMFSKHIDVKNSNEVAVLAILEALHMFVLTVMSS